LNVALTIEQICGQSEIIAELEHAGKVKLAVGIYEVETRRVTSWIIQIFKLV